MNEELIKKVLTALNDNIKQQAWEAAVLATQDDKICKFAINRSGHHMATWDINTGLVITNNNMSTYSINTLIKNFK